MATIMEDLEKLISTAKEMRDIPNGILRLREDAFYATTPPKHPKQEWFCMQCGGEVKEGEHFCNSFCRQDYVDAMFDEMEK